AFVIARIGARNTVVLALLLTAVASALRAAAPGIGLLLTTTVIMGLGIAAMQPALPALVPRWCPQFVALGSAVYLNGTMMGEFAGAGLTLPIVLPLAGGGWRGAFLLWSLPAIAIAFALFYPHQQGMDRPKVRTRSLPAWNDRQMWQFGLMLGTMSATFFGLNAYLSSVLADKNMRDWLDIMLFVFNLAQVLASAFMLAAPRRMIILPRLLFATTTLITLSLLGFVLFTGLPALLAAMLLSFFSGIHMIVLVTLPPLLRSPHEAGILAAGLFAIGYGLAFLLPLGAGAIADASGTTLSALWLFAAANMLCLPLAWWTRIRPNDRLI